MSPSDLKSFTLIELLIVIGILAVLVAAIVITLNPAQLLAQARDSKRQQDLSALNQALNTITTLDQSLFMGTSSLVYTSLPDATTTCANWNLPSLPSGWQYYCVATSSLQNTNGTGWIPVNFKTTGVVSLASLPTDPINTSSTGLYYTYVSGGSFELTAAFESSKFKLGGDKDIVSTDGGSYPDLYEVGSNLSLAPLDYGDTSLVGYWPLNEGTGTIAYDRSGKGNNGTGGANAPWASGGSCERSSGSCLIMNSYYVFTVQDTSSLDLPNAITIAAWFKPITLPSAQIHPIQKWTSTIDANYVWYWQVNNLSFLDANLAGVWTGISTLGALMPSSGWHYIVFTYNGSVGNSYLDGISKYSTVVNPPMATNGANLVFGRDVDASAAIGLDDVRIYNRALSASEVSALYNATK